MKRRIGIDLLTTLNLVDLDLNRQELQPDYENSLSIFARLTDDQKVEIVVPQSQIVQCLILAQSKVDYFPGGIKDFYDKLQNYNIDYAERYRTENLEVSRLNYPSDTNILDALLLIFAQETQLDLLISSDPEKLGMLISANPEFFRDFHLQISTLEDFIQTVGTTDPNCLSPVSNIIYPYTPEGDIKELTRNSTVLDFAYKVHSKIGDQCSGGSITRGDRSFISPINGVLQSGDIVEIITSSTVQPSERWLGIARTPNALRHIKATINRNYKKKGEKLYHDILPRMLSNNLTYAIIRKSGYRFLSQLYTALGKGHITPRFLLLIASEYSCNSQSQPLLSNVTVQICMDDRPDTLRPVLNIFNEHFPLVNVREVQPIKNGTSIALIEVSTNCLSELDHIFHHVKNRVPGILSIYVNLSKIENQSIILH